MGLLLSYSEGRMALFDTGLFDHREKEKDKNYFILKMDLEYSLELHERDDDYPLAPVVITIKPEITGEKQHNLHAQYFGAACPYSLKLICFFFPKTH